MHWCQGAVAAKFCDALLKILDALQLGGDSGFLFCLTCVVPRLLQLLEASLLRLDKGNEPLLLGDDGFAEGVGIIAPSCRRWKFVRARFSAPCEPNGIAGSRPDS